MAAFLNITVAQTDKGVSVGVFRRDFMRHAQVVPVFVFLLFAI